MKQLKDMKQSEKKWCFSVKCLWFIKIILLKNIIQLTCLNALLLIQISTATAIWCITLVFSGCNHGIVAGNFKFRAGQSLLYGNLPWVYLKVQSGFRNKHNDETAIQCAIHDQKNSYVEVLLTLIVFLHLQQEFKITDCSRMLLKLRNIQLFGKALKRITDYLQNRRQKLI